MPEPPDGEHEQFQSLNRAYKRSDQVLYFLLQFFSAVSIPQSGLQAFRRRGLDCPGTRTQMFQSLNRAYKRSDQMPSWRMLRGRHVSIPQSGLQAFRLDGKRGDDWK